MLVQAEPPWPTPKTHLACQLDGKLKMSVDIRLDRLPLPLILCPLHLFTLPQFTILQFSLLFSPLSFRPLLIKSVSFSLLLFSPLPESNNVSNENETRAKVFLKSLST